MDILRRLERFYENEGREELRLQPDSIQYLEYLTATRYMERFLPSASNILDSCAGTGVYSFYLAERGHRVTAGDLVPYNVEILRQKQRDTPILADIYEGDALNLSRFSPESFDAVLCMGALYHLAEAADRKRAVAESLRVLRQDGLFLCTYMSRYAVILNNCTDHIDAIMRFCADGIEDIFYASTPEEMERLASDCGIEKVCHTALDGMACFLHHTAGLLGHDALQKWHCYHFATCEEPSLLGGSYHNLYIGRKV